MQLEIYNPTSGQPLPPIEWNFEAIKAWLKDGLAAYKGRVYDETQITQAKKDAANLRKLKDAIDGKRKEVKATYLAPVEEFTKQARELTDMIDAQVGEITAQVKTYDDFRRQEKQAEIEKVYTALIGDLAEMVPYERLHNPKWLNVTYSMTNISEELARSIESIEAALSSINTLDIPPEIAKLVKAAYLRNFDLAAALAEKERFEKQQAEIARYEAAKNERRVFDASDPEAFKNARPGDVVRFGGQDCVVKEGKYTPAESVEPVTAPRGAAGEGEKVHTVTFRIHVTAAQLKALGSFMKEHGIKPERV